MQSPYFCCLLEISHAHSNHTSSQDRWHRRSISMTFKKWFSRLLSSKNKTIGAVALWYCISALEVIWKSSLIIEDFSTIIDDKVIDCRWLFSSIILFIDDFVIDMKRSDPNLHCWWRRRDPGRRASSELSHVIPAKNIITRFSHQSERYTWFLYFRYLGYRSYFVWRIPWSDCPGSKPCREVACVQRS